MSVKLKIVVRPDLEDGGFVAECPALPGCVSQGETREEALENIRDAIEGVLSVLNARAQRHGPTEQILEVEV